VIVIRIWPQDCQPCGLVEENGVTPPVSQVDFRSATVVTLAGGVHEEEVFFKQNDAGCNRDVEVPEEEVVRKQDGAGCNRAYGVSERDVVRKHDGAVRIRISRWLQECQPCGLVDENGRNTPVS
jgi:hypothetical protein